MARIGGVDIPVNKRGFVSLTYIFGIGRSTALDVLEKAKVDPQLRVKDWSDAQTAAIRKYISETVKVEGELRGEVQSNIKRLMDIGCYRGLRHRRGLPLRGQRTKTNCRTRKGKRKTIANKKKVTK